MSSNSKERRRAARAAKFGNHVKDERYIPDAAPSGNENRSGREWDSERATKADERELENVDRDEPTALDRDRPEQRK